MIITELADERDLEAIADLLYEMKVHYWGPEAHSRAEIDAYVKENFFQPHCGVDVALARENGKAVGLATFSILYPGPDGGGQLYLKDLFTTRSSRGKGVGLALMRYLARYAIDHQCNRLDWTAETDNPDAIAFYERIGASKVEEKVYFRFTGEDLDAFAKKT